MEKQKQDDHQEHMHNSSVLIWDVALKTCRNWSTIEKGDEKGSGISALMAQLDDDDDDDVFNAESIPLEEQ